METLAYFLFPFLFVEFLTGFFHWLEDTYGHADIPIIGPLVIAPNIEHHKHPMAFTQSSFWARNSITLALAAVFAVVWFFAGWMTPVWAAAIALGGIGNEIHYWTHCRASDVPPVVRWLQDLRILQTRRHHVVGHHQSPFDGHYCIMFNALNPILDRSGFWRGLEWVILRTTGLVPRARATT